MKALRNPGQSLRWMNPYDYVSPGLKPLPADIERYFPLIGHGRSWNPRVPHRQRFDQRYPEMGLITWDESTLLYNYAQQFASQDLLEIGCWIGWSTLAFALGGVRLTVIDPVLEDDKPQGATCRQALEQAGLSGTARLIGGYSPQAVDELTAQGCSWSICFIDAVHHGDAPLRDAQVCARAARDDCLILFHDMLQPDVGRALSWLRGEGWNCGVHYTCWFVGVAWRGSAQPLQHTPDPKVDWGFLVRKLCPHLVVFPRI